MWEKNFKNFSLIIFLMLYSHVCIGMFGVDNQTEFIKSISRKFDIKTVFLVTQDKTSEDVFNIRKNLNQCSEFFTCILTVKNFRNDIRKISDQRSLIVLHMDDIILREMISVSNTMNLSDFTWVCFSFSSRLSSTYFNDVFIPMNTKFFYASYEDEKVFINEVYQVTKNSTKLGNYYGTWEYENGLVAVEKDFYERRRNFAQARLKLAIKNGVPDPFDPCAFGNIDEIREPPVIECLFFRIWKDLEITYNFTIENILFPLNGLQFTLQLILEKIRSREVDGTTAPYTMTSDRVLENEYLWPVYSTNLLAFTKVPRKEINYTSYLQPFCFRLWMAVLSWIVITAILMVLAKYILVRVILRENFSFLRDGTDYLNFSFSALCSQSLEIDLENRITFRILIMVLRFLPLFILPAYSGGLISFIGNPNSVIPFSNMREFEEDGNYELTTSKPSFMYVLLESDSKFAKAREKNLIRSSDKMHTNHDYGMTLVCQNRVTYLTDTPLVLKNSVKCSIFQMGDYFGVYFPTMVVSKGSPFAELFNRILQRRQMCGMETIDLRKLIMDNVKVEPIFSVSENPDRMLHASSLESVSSFTFHDVLPIFVILGAGLVLSTVILAGEILFATVTKTLSLKGNFIV